MQNTFTKYGEESLVFSVIDLPSGVDEPTLRAVEAGVIRGLKQSGLALCNIAMDTTAPMMGRKHTPAALQNMAAAQQQRLARERSQGLVREVSAETRLLLSKAGTGRKKSLEACRAISDRVRGSVRSPETRERIRQAQLLAKVHLGKPKSDRQRAAMSAARKDKRALVATPPIGSPRVFESVTQAARTLGLNKGNVSEAASRQGRFVKGWAFQFVTAEDFAAHTLSEPTK